MTATTPDFEAHVRAEWRNAPEGAYELAADLASRADGDGIVRTLPPQWNNTASGMFEAQGLLEAIHVAGVPVVRLMLPAPEPLSILEPVIPVVLDVQTESIAAEWEWDASKGLQSAKQWSLELNACKASGLTATDKLIAWAIREHVNVKDGTVYIGSDRVAQFIGRSSDNVKKRRKALQDAGWFQDTGRKVGFAKVWRLNIPECDCGAHGGFTPVRTKG